MTCPPRTASCPVRACLRLEALEDRTLLSAAAYDPTQILVQFRTAAPAGPAPVLNVPGAVLGPQLNSVPGLYEVRLAGLSVPAALALFQADPRVLSAQPDYLATVAGTPNDPQFPNQWGLQNTGQNGGAAGVDIKATQAWTVTTGSPGVTVAAIDTGIDYDNADLYQNIWINQAEVPNWWYTKSSDGTFDKVVYKSQIVTATPGVITFADLNNPVNKGLVWDTNGDGRIDAGDLLRPFSQGGWDNNGNDTKDGDTAHPDDFFGWNFVNNDNNPFDENGHGTNVAGTLGAQGNNGVGVAGVDWNVQIMDLQVFDSTGTGSVANIIAAIDYSIQHGAKISNNSWALVGASGDTFNAIAAAQQAGQIFVVAAGNGGASQPTYPALYTPQLNNIVSVAAITNTGQLWSNSDYGASTVTLAAPGVGILSTAPGGRFVSYTGTSQAVPFVTGTLALVWGQHPTWTYQQVIAQVTSTVTPLASLKGKTITGGIVNAGAAVGYVAAPPAAAHVLSAAFSGPDGHSLNSILVTFDQIIDPAKFTAANVHLTNPSGQTVPLTAVMLAPGSDGHQYLIDFNTQTAGGVYTLSIPAGVVDHLGGSLTPYTASFTLTPATYTFSSTGAVPVPAYGTASSSITVNQSFTITAVKVQLNITAAQDGPLYLYLQAPNGTQIVLALGRGGAGANFVNTVFVDTASTAIGSAAAPFTGSFRPEIPLSIFNGMNAAGVWKLTVQDRSGNVVGVINSWSLIFTPAVPGSSSAAAAGGQATGAQVQGSAPRPIVDRTPTGAADAVFISWFNPDGVRLG